MEVLNTPSVRQRDALPPSLDYNFLREEGLKHIRRLSGDIWSDHNVGDPGITMLEVLCLAILDINYRISFDIKDLIANEQGDLYDNIYTPSEILPCNPLTINDYRKILINLPAVKNAWITPIKDANPALYHNPRSRNISFNSSENKRINIKGLYEVLIEQEAAYNEEDVVKAVKEKLTKHENLCEDFTAVTVLPKQSIAITATLEVGDVKDAAQLLAEVYHKIAQFISPRVRFYTLQELLAKGRKIDDIIEGPPLTSTAGKYRFIDTQELERYDKKRELRSSDLIQEIMDIDGVTLVKHIQMRKEKEEADKEETDGKETDEEETNGKAETGWSDSAWILQLDATKAPQLAFLPFDEDTTTENRSIITLTKGNVQIDVDWNVVKKKYTALQEQLSTTAAGTEVPRLPKRRVRQLETYYSIQNDFPAVYGIGKLGLSGNAPYQRKAQAKQLKAYLLFFEQLLANYLSQLAHVKDLFSYKPITDTTPSTYFSQQLFSLVPGIDTIFSPKENYEEALNVWKEGDSTALERSNRFLNHLMARFEEQFSDYALRKYATQRGNNPEEAEEALLKHKRDFLKDYQTASNERATQQGLMKRIRAKLGLTDSETFDIVEHIALRPTEDNPQGGAFFTSSRPVCLQPRPNTDPDNQSHEIICDSPKHGLQVGEVIEIWNTVYYRGVYKVETIVSDKTFCIKQQNQLNPSVALDVGQWFKYGTHQDPFSLQLSFLFPKEQSNIFQEVEFQAYAKEVIRAETPAHLKVYVHWLTDDEMEKYNRNKPN